MKLIKLLFLMVCTILLSACGQTYENVQTIESPDGKLKLMFSLKDGNPEYSIQKNGKQVLLPSKMGFIFEGNDSLFLKLKIININKNSKNETWKQVWGEEVEVRNNYNELKVGLKEKEGKLRKLNIIFRVFNDGVGFRYEIPSQKKLQKINIQDELTEFVLAKNDSAWAIPAYKGVYYEELWTKKAVNDLDTVTTPITIETKDRKYILLHEAGLIDYAKMNLYPITGTTTLKTDLTPWSDGMKVYSKSPMVTPWRTIVLADDLNQLVNSRLMLNLNEPSKIKDTSWIKPIKYVGIWWGMHMDKYTWAQGPKHGATTENVKKYIDFASENDIQGVLVEGWNYGWDGDWVENGDKFSFTKTYPDFDIEKISTYAKNKNIKLIGHHETGGATINYERQLDSAFAFYQKHGVNLVKTGYVNPLLDKKERHSSQYGVRHYQKVIETAAKYGIMVDVHEPIMPTGLQRTYPNLMTHEGVRGQEYDAWSSDGGNPPEHTCIIPFTRGLAGPMDFTPGTFNFSNTSHPGTRVQTTIAKQLALYIVIYSPLQMASDLPENYIGNPAFEFIKLVPVNWAKTIILDGEIGDYVVTARKDKYSNSWFVGAITDEKSRNLTIKFNFLDVGKKYELKIYKDAQDSDWKTNPTAYVIEKLQVDSNSELELFLAKGGGAALFLQEL
ncbi:MAG: glycoside hydrolase family 97 protein [Bacteroidales bacterium]|nr:glycoside hydrolase family 97 protein [Bacteroidales bacterium]